MSVPPGTGQCLVSQCPEPSPAGTSSVTCGKPWPRGRSLQCSAAHAWKRWHPCERFPGTVPAAENPIPSAGGSRVNEQTAWGERLEAEQPHSHCLATQGKRVLRAQPGNGSQFAAGLHPVNGGIRGAVLFTHRAALGSAGLAPCLGFPTSGMAGGDACLPYTEQNKKSISFFFPLLTHQRRKKWFGLHLS